MWIVGLLIVVAIYFLCYDLRKKNEEEKTFVKQWIAAKEKEEFRQLVAEIKELRAFIHEVDI